MPVTIRETKYLKSLTTKKGRREHGRFMAEGVRLLEQALLLKARPDKIFHSPSLLSDRGHKLVRNFSRIGIPILEMSGRQASQVGDVRQSQGIIGTFPIQNEPDQQLRRPSCRKTLWCEGIADPGNLGTLMRSALAFGFDSIIFSGTSADVFSPKVVRSSAGSIFGLEITRADTAEVLTLARREGLKVIAAVSSGGSDTAKLGPLVENDRIVLAIGSEASGLSKNIVDAAAIKVQIKHRVNVESLNAAVAGSILMKELYDFK